MISTLKSSHRKKNIVHVDCRSILHSPYVISFLFLCSTKFQSMDEQQSIYTVSTEIWPSVWQSQPSQQKNSRSDDVLAAGTASGCWATWELVKLSQKPFPRYYRNLRHHYRGITAAVASITAVNPRLPRYYRCPHYRAGLYFKGNCRGGLSWGRQSARARWLHTMCHLHSFMITEDGMWQLLTCYRQTIYLKAHISQFMARPLHTTDDCKLGGWETRLIACSVCDNYQQAIYTAPHRVYCSIRTWAFRESTMEKPERE